MTPPEDAVDPDSAIDVGREALYVTLMVCTPLLATGLLVGLSVSILQAVTQIQEQTLAFVPKILAIMVALLLLMPWLITKVTEYTTALIISASQFD